MNIRICDKCGDLVCGEPSRRKHICPESVDERVEGLKADVADIRSDLTKLRREIEALRKEI